MNLYLCVYRQPIPKNGDWKSVCREASSNEALKEYLQRYNNRFKKRKRCFYDWGDDPAFYAAEKFQSNVTWGACRSNVRKKLKKGDIVIFFCAQQQKKKGRWKYYYVGLGTVSEIVKCRKQLWENERYRDFRDFYNLLIDSRGVHRELITCHPDWADRLEAPYIIFDKDPAKTHFNVTNPLHVATCNSKDEARRRKEKGKTMEVWWSSKDELVNRIYDLVPERENGKKLMTSETGFSHVFMNLRKFWPTLSDMQWKRKVQEYLKVSNEVASG